MATTGRDRILAALDGEVIDRVPLALGFFAVDGAALAPPGTWRDDLVDVTFVEFPISAEEEDLRRRAMPYDGDTRSAPSARSRGMRDGTTAPSIRSGATRSSTPGRSRISRRSPSPRSARRRPSTSLARQVATIHAHGLAAAGNTPHLGGELFEAAWRLRGLENFLVDLVERKDMAHFLLDRLADLARRNAVVLARAGVDLLALDDDVGMPGTMMIGPGTWREFFKPRLVGIIGAARAVQPGLRVAYHSDGYIEPILDDLVEIGVQAINPLQPEHMDAARIRRRFGVASCSLGHRRPADDVLLRRAGGHPGRGPGASRDARAGGPRPRPRLRHRRAGRALGEHRGLPRSRCSRWPYRPPDQPTNCALRLRSACSDPAEPRAEPAYR